MTKRQTRAANRLASAITVADARARLREIITDESEDYDRPAPVLTGRRFQLRIARLRARATRAGDWVMLAYCQRAAATCNHHKGSAA